MNEEQFILSILVNNESGVLTRVSGLFARRAYNIDSLSVGVTEDPRISRITITARGDEYIKNQILQQVAKLHDVKFLELMPPEETVMRELLLVKVNGNQAQLERTKEIARSHQARVVDFTANSITLEFTGEGAKCDEFAECLRPIGIAELCRTGLTALTRGNHVLSVPNH